MCRYVRFAGGQVSEFMDSEWLVEIEVEHGAEL
jgi:hypothetical protein